LPGEARRIDPATNKVTARLKLSSQPCAFVVADRTRIWASGGSCGAYVARSDLRTKKPMSTVTGFLQPVGLAFAFGSVWVADVVRKTIDRISPRTGRIVARLPVGGFPVRLAVGFGSVWVRDDTGRVLRIDPRG
jgi:DNA-binding beta-propeller fold protein YncE